MANNLVTEAYLAANFSPKSGITPGSDDHAILNCTEILARYNVTISPSTGKYCPKQSELTSASITVPTVDTDGDMYSITQTYAETSFYITSNGGASIIDCGLCWSTSTTPTIANSKTTQGSQPLNTLIDSTMESLEHGTTYYYRAYATNSAGTGYSSILSFTTYFTQSKLIVLSNSGDANKYTPIITVLARNNYIYGFNSDFLLTSNFPSIFRTSSKSSVNDQAAPISGTVVKFEIDGYASNTPYVLFNPSIHKIYGLISGTDYSAAQVNSIISQMTELSVYSYGDNFRANITFTPVSAESNNFIYLICDLRT